jgi:hypothetical protein
MKWKMLMKNKECVSHVQKQVGAALWKLKKETKGIGGKGKLTDSLIDNYHRIAITSNSGDLEGMRSSICASLFHCPSSERRKLTNTVRMVLIVGVSISKTRQTILASINQDLVFLTK